MIDRQAAPAPLTDAGRLVRHPRFALPDWTRAIRVRLTLTYSSLLFGVTALLLGGVYLALSRTIAAEPLDPVTVKRFEKNPDGTIVYRPGEEFEAADLASVQMAVNYAALETLRNYSVIALMIMFALSLLIGWWVAGRALRPVERITTTAREISATDLTRRIGAVGPRDELRTLADTIDDMLARLDKSFKDQRTLVEDVSHELRNPVAVIQTNVEAVLGNDASTQAERREATAVVTRATTRMSRLLEDLLATARKRSSAFLDRELELGQIGHNVTDAYRLVASGRAIRLDLHTTDGLLVYGDPEALERAISNLMSNAVRFSTAGSTITVATGSRTGWAWIAVRDAGPGIAEDDQERVFERFHRGSDPTAAPASGSGLGLAIARQIAESHEGRIALHSHPGLGSTFVLWPSRPLLLTAPRRRAARRRSTRQPLTPARFHSEAHPLPSKISSRSR